MFNIGHSLYEIQYACRNLLGTLSPCPQPHATTTFTTTLAMSSGMLVTATTIATIDLSKLSNSNNIHNGAQSMAVGTMQPSMHTSFA